MAEEAVSGIQTSRHNKKLEKNKNKRRRRGEKRGQFNHEEADHVRWLGLFFSLRQTYGGENNNKKKKRPRKLVQKSVVRSPPS
jgi:hypothetical protein